MTADSKEPLQQDSQHPQKTDAFGKEPTLAQDAIKAFRVLKRKHRAQFESDPKDFRRQVHKAQSRVLSLKRGPKPDPAISSAAREVAAGAKIETIFQTMYDPDLKTKNEDLCAMALENFRVKVNTYIRRHPFLKRQREQKKTS